MDIFFGAAIQGHSKRGDRASLYSRIIGAIKELGHSVLTEHTTAQDQQQTLDLMTASIGTLPQDPKARFIYVRNKMIELLEGDIGAAVFEASTPSLGTGIEIAHAYLRPRLGLTGIPVIVLYEIDYWPNHLTTMIRGMTSEVTPHLKVVEYQKGCNFYSVLSPHLGKLG